MCAGKSDKSFNEAYEVEVDALHVRHIVASIDKAVQHQACIGVADRWVQPVVGDHQKGLVVVDQFIARHKLEPNAVAALTTTTTSASEQRSDATT